MKINQTKSFKSKVKKLHQNQKTALDKAIKQIIDDPSIGQLKKGDLSDVRVYKFKMLDQLTLLAYLYNTNKKISCSLKMASGFSSTSRITNMVSKPSRIPSRHSMPVGILF